MIAEFTPRQERDGFAAQARTYSTTPSRSSRCSKKDAAICRDEQSSRTDLHCPELLCPIRLHPIFIAASSTPSCRLRRSGHATLQHFFSARLQRNAPHPQPLSNFASLRGEGSFRAERASFSPSPRSIAKQCGVGEGVRGSGVKRPRFPGRYRLKRPPSMPPTAGLHDATPNTVTIPPSAEKRTPRFSSFFTGFGAS